jgi:hypothetical protein
MGKWQNHIHCLSRAVLPVQFVINCMLDVFSKKKLHGDRWMIKSIEGLFGGNQRMEMTIVFELKFTVREKKRSL